MKIEHVSVTHQGRRGNNEDACRAHPELGLFVVADGMGGYAGGEIASRITVDEIYGFLQRNAADGEATWPFALDRSRSFAENLISIAVRLAHAQIVHARQDERFDHMGSTVAALLLDGGEAIVAHVGDSRVYRLRGGELEQLTRDHSLWAEMVAAGVLETPDRRSFGMTNVITRALGIAGATPDLRRERVEPGDTYLLCTDGLIERLDDATLRELIEGAPPAEAGPELVRRAYDAGGHDNITLVLVRVTEI